MKFLERLQHSWNAFLGRDAPIYYDYGSTVNEGRYQISVGNDRTDISTIYNRIATDVSAIAINHVRLDENGRFKEIIPDELNNCLNLEANIDQTGRAFIQDVVMSMLDEGCVAIVPIEATVSASTSEFYKIENMRVGKIIEWYPRHVKVNLYNEKTGKKEDVVIAKRSCAIIENPFYSIMNTPNSTAQRLIRKMRMLDVVDEISSSGKLNMFIHLPYTVRSEIKKKEAYDRTKEIERQLIDSKYGIAYIDGTEKITQINRGLENNLLEQIKYLRENLYSQLGMPKDVFDGTADEKTMLNYNNRTIEPIMSAIRDEMVRKFLTKTARTQGQSIEFFSKPFRLVPVSQLAEIADKFTRNEILSSNEIRQIIGYVPSDDPKADELRNKNLNRSEEYETDQPYQEEVDPYGYEDTNLEGEIQNEREV
ncbi:MAG: phage portal protein [Erysipelotrichia bacterium]|nr:phage portal protein [Erysipelotrichia bacterium]